MRASKRRLFSISKLTRSRAALWPLVALAALAAGCATPTATSPPAEPQKKKTAPVARYNLSGYSAAFKQGYADACASRRNDQRFKTDADYQMGWTDGKSLCGRR